MTALCYDSLLGLPETSDAFTAHMKTTIVPKNEDIEKIPFSPHPRKTPSFKGDWGHK